MFEDVRNKLFSYEDMSDEGIQYTDSNESNVFCFYDCVLKRDFGEFSEGTPVDQIDWILEQNTLLFYKNHPMEFDLDGKILSKYLDEELEVPEEAIPVLWECENIATFFIEFDFKVLVELNE